MWWGLQNTDSATLWVHKETLKSPRAEAISKSVPQSISTIQSIADYSLCLEASSKVHRRGTQLCSSMAIRPIQGHSQLASKVRGHSSLRANAGKALIKGAAHSSSNPTPTLQTTINSLEESERWMMTRRACHEAVLVGPSEARTKRGLVLVLVVLYPLEKRLQGHTFSRDL